MLLQPMSRQTYCIEYKVTGSLDGTTEAPELAAPRSTGNTHQFYVPSEAVQDLGLIDPDFTPLGIGTSIANRLVVFLWIKGAAPGGANARVDVVDVDDPSAVQEPIASLNGQTQAYIRSGIFLPQGSALRLQGLVPDANGQITVRLYIQVVDTTEQAALVLEALAATALVSGIYRTVFVSKLGNDENTGLTPEQAKLTISDALLTAATLGPTQADPVVVQVLDPGVYVEDLICISDVFVQGPNAKVIGSITLPPRVVLNLYEVEQSGAGVIAISRVGNPGTAYVNLRRLVCNDTVIGLLCSGADNVVIFHCEQVFVEDGIGLGDIATGDGHMHFEVEDIYLTGAGSPVGVARAGAALSVGRVTHLLNEGPSATTTGILVFSGQVDMAVRYMNPNTAYVIAAAGNLSLQVANIDVASARTVIGAGILQLSESKRDNPTAVAPPAAGNDYSEGYRVGSIWYDTIGGVLYTCTDPSVGAAVWV